MRGAGGILGIVRACGHGRFASFLVLLLLAACAAQEPSPTVVAVDPSPAPSSAAAGEIASAGTARTSQTSKTNRAAAATAAAAASAPPAPPKTLSASLQEANRLYAYRFQAGDYETALAHALYALRQSERGLGSDHPTTAGLLANVGSSYQRLGRLVEAEALLKHAVSILADRLGEQHAVTLNARNSLAAALIEEGKLDEAEALLSSVLRAGDDLRDGHAGTLAAALNNLAAIQVGRGDDAAALRLYRQALPLAQAVYGPDHTVSRDLRQRIAMSAERLPGISEQPDAAVSGPSIPEPAREPAEHSPPPVTPSMPVPVQQSSDSAVPPTAGAVTEDTSQRPPLEPTPAQAQSPAPAPAAAASAAPRGADDSRRERLLAALPVPTGANDRLSDAVADEDELSAMDRAVQAYHEKRYAAALSIWRKLAKSGSRRAKLHLGGMYMDGSGVERDLVRAYYWLTLSHQAGDPLAGQLLADLVPRMTALQIEVAEDTIAGMARTGSGIAPTAVRPPDA